MAEVSVLKINGTSYDVKDKQAVRFYDNVAAMTADATVKNGQTLRTLGYYAINDGGGALYKVVNTAPSGHYEALQGNLYAEYIIENVGINIKALGAYGDYLVKENGAYVENVEIVGNTITRLMHDDSAKFTYAISLAKASINKTIYLPAGVYWVTGSFVVNEGIHFVGEGSPTPPLYDGFNNVDWDYGSVSGSIIANTGTASSLFKLSKSSSIESIGFWYPEQKMKGLVPGGSDSPIVYPSTISLIKDPTTNSNNRDVVITKCYFCNPYIAIDASSEHSGLTVSSITGYAIFRFLIIDKCTDVDRTMHVQLNCTKMYKGSWPNNNVLVWQIKNANNNCGILIKKADAPLFLDVAVIGFGIGFWLQESTEKKASTAPNGVVFIDCMAEWCLRAVYAVGLVTWLKFHHCSFGTLVAMSSERDTNGNYKWKNVAVEFNGRTDGIDGKRSAHIILDDVRVWSAYERAISFQNCDDIALTNVSVDGYQPKVFGSAINTALYINNCNLIRGTGIKLSGVVPIYSNKSAYLVGDWCYNNKKFYKCTVAITRNSQEEFNSDGANFNSSHWSENSTIKTNFDGSLYLYMRGSTGFGLNNIVCNGFDYNTSDNNKARLSFSVNGSSVACSVGKVTSIIGNHNFTVYKHTSCSNVTVEEPIIPAS